MASFKSTSSQSNKYMQSINESANRAKDVNNDNSLSYLRDEMLRAAEQFNLKLNSTILEGKITSKEGKLIIDETRNLVTEVKKLMKNDDYGTLFDGMVDVTTKFQNLQIEINKLPPKEQSSINFKAFFTAVESFFNKISDFILKSFNANDTASVSTKQTASTKSMSSEFSDDSMHSLDTVSTHSYASEESHNNNSTADYRARVNSGRNEAVEEAVELELNVIDDSDEEENNYGFN